jgi:CBS domain-containing protein
MSVASICTRDIVSLNRSATLQQAARLMHEQHVGTVVVTQETPGGTSVVGLVTDRDLVIEVLARGLSAEHVQLAAMLDGHKLHSVAEQADIGEAVATMQAAGVRRLLVRDDEGHLVGLLSFDDLIRACAEQFSGLAGVLSKGLQREVAAGQSPGQLGKPPPLRPLLRVPAMGTAGWQQGPPGVIAASPQAGATP